MLNLLQFTPGGEQEYEQYVSAIRPFLAAAGGELVYAGDTSEALVAPETDTSWDAVLLVRYPSRRAFSQMVADPEYQEITHLRTSALKATVLQPTAERHQNGVS